MNLTRLLDAESEVLSLADVKNQLRIGSSTADHDSFRHFISAIRHRTELFLGKTLITSTWELKLDAFDAEIQLPMWPIQSISSVKYYDTDGVEQTLDSSSYQYDTVGRLAPSYGNSWPSARYQYDSITITYIAGKTHAGNVEPDIKLAMLLWVGACDIARENTVIGAGVVVSEIPKGAESLLSPHRRQMV